MSQSEMRFTSLLYDLETGQDHNHHPLDPCITSRTMADFLNPNNHPILPSPGNNRNQERHLPPNHHESNIFYGNHGLQHQQTISSLHLGGYVLNSSHNHYSVPPSSRLFRMPLNNVFDHIVTSSDYGINGLHVNDGRNLHFADNIRGSSKRKNAEVLPSNQYYIDNSESSSSASLGFLTNLQPLQPEAPYAAVGIGMFETTFAPSEYHGNGIYSIAEGPARSVSSRPRVINQQLDSSLAHHHGQLLQGDHISHSSPPSSNLRPEQFGQMVSEANWNHGCASSNTRGRSTNGSSVEIGGAWHQGFLDGTMNTNSGIIYLSSHHHYLQHMQAMRSRNYGYCPQITPTSYRPLINSFNGSSFTTQCIDLEPGSRYSSPLMSSDDRIYRHQRRPSQAGSDDISQRMRLFSSNDVAMMDYSSFHGAGNLIDQHRDMRLEIDDMSYEELIALEERIGDVSVGLSEETISKCLKVRKYVPCSVASMDLSIDMTMLEDKETCIICQAEYEGGEKIGVLECGHDYHVQCIKQWLSMKNACPICKEPAAHGR